MILIITYHHHLQIEFNLGRVGLNWWLHFIKKKEEEEEDQQNNS